MLYISKIISGGQTGADLGGLIGAYRAGVATGGTAPKYFRTEDGNMPELLKQYGLQESSKKGYPPRTEQNVIDSDLTVIWGTNSKGVELTKHYCRKHNKHWVQFDPTQFWMHSFIKFLDGDIALYALCGSDPEKQKSLDKKGQIVINVAGNRESKYPGIQARVARLTHHLLVYRGVIPKEQLHSLFVN